MEIKEVGTSHPPLCVGDIIKTNNFYGRVNNIFSTDDATYEYTYDLLCAPNYKNAFRSVIHESMVVRAYADCTIDEIINCYPEEFI
jgi:hypothetical protein